ncbi:MAG: hypothetical protein V4638_02190 [Bacteroidota bacterium]
MNHFITTLSVFALSFTALAQTESATATADWSPEIYQVGKMYPGYIINLDGDTIQGFIKADQRCSIAGIGSSNQNTCAFYVNEADKKPAQKYKPADLKGYKIADKVYESIKYSGGLLKAPNFNLVVQEGAIRMYEWYATKENYASISKQSGETWLQYDARRFDSKQVVAKEGTDPIEVSMLGLSFAKKMPEMIADHKELAAKVANKEKGYGFLRIYEVIDEYNKWKANN